MGTFEPLSNLWATHLLRDWRPWSVQTFSRNRQFGPFLRIDVRVMPLLWWFFLTQSPFGWCSAAHVVKTSRSGSQQWNLANSPCRFQCPKLRARVARLQSLQRKISVAIGSDCCAKQMGFIWPEENYPLVDWMSSDLEGSIFWNETKMRRGGKEANGDGI